ncbi:YczE/YyaS/YitT family protein [Lihuaxuella thermophila]|uniref:Membrane protein YczE n=1 Tax=Lihuaxuella thermophila TaxID=1173111 RepID=A0A1H8E4W3_9BACL|nr:hypothetical protein [Lihuaxuella thermophila]SEN13807.1 hypothetical protein SAMN05444955_106104 [Lihuaxuella thermophila]
MMYKAVIRIVMYIAGLVLQSLGLALMIVSDLGTGPWDGFYVGMTRHFGLSVGLWLIIFGVIFIILSSYLMKCRTDFLSFMTVFILGLCIDFWLQLISFQPVEAGVKVLIFWLGLFVTSFGISIYLQGEIALTPADQFMMALCDRFGLSLMASKFLGDAGALVFAVLLQGPIGLGTLIYTFLSGPLVQFFTPRMERAVITRIKK